MRTEVDVSHSFPGVLMTGGLYLLDTARGTWVSVWMWIAAFMFVVRTVFVVFKLYCVLNCAEC